MSIRYLINHAFVILLIGVSLASAMHASDGSENVPASSIIGRVIGVEGRPVELQDLLDFLGRSEGGNSKEMVNYIGDIFPISPESNLSHVIEVLRLVDPLVFNQAIDQLHPGLFGGVEWTNLTQASYVAALLANHLRELSCSPRNCCSIKQPSPKNGIWANPYGIWENQDKLGQLRGFESSTVGVIFGYDRCWGRFQFGAAAGYGHTHIGWKGEAGGGSDNRVYGALYTSYTHPLFMADLSILGGGNFYSLHRSINYSTSGSSVAAVSYQANSHFFGGTFHAHLGLAARFNKWKVPLQVAGKLDYDYLHREKFRESGAGDLDLNVQTKISNMIRTELGVEYAPTLCFPYGCVSPYIGVAWVVKIPLSDSKIGASFVRQTQTFNVETTSHAIQQVMPSCGFKIGTVRGLFLALSGRAELSGEIQDYFIDLRLDYCF